MPDERIEISFEDDENGKDSSEDQNLESQDKEKLEITFEDDNADKDVEQEKSIEDEIKSLQFNSFYHGSPRLDNYFDSGINFPEGIEKGFRENFKHNLKETFFNSILENNLYFIVSSSNGSVYFIDRFTKQIKERASYGGVSFEKTGMVIDNLIYLNSLTSIYCISNDNVEAKSFPQPFYNSESGYYIWSNLNYCDKLISFLEYSPEQKRGNFVLFDTISNQCVFKESFSVRSYLNHLSPVIGELIYFLVDNNMYICNLSKSSVEAFNLGFESDENAILFGVGNKLYLTSKDGKVYFLESGSWEFKYTGISEHFINSAAGFEDNIFVGTDSGWRYYKSNGVLVYSHDDTDENRVECTAKNVLVVSKKNKIVFHNLNLFQEAEGFVIRDKDEGAQEIFSSIISYNDIYVLTKQGIIAGFTNDKLNIHI